MRGEVPQPATYRQAKPYMAAVCKTVGSAYVGSNPTPATTCEDGPWAAHVLTTIGEPRDRGVTVRSLTENFDLATKEGRFIFAVLAAAAEYELELRAGRQAEGIAAARRRQADGTMLPGKKRIGRPRAVGPAELRQLQRMTGEGAPARPHPEDLSLHRLRRPQAAIAAPGPQQLSSS